MTEKLKEKTKELLESRPVEVRDIVNSFDWGKISEEIGSKYQLNESQLNDLQVETMLVLTGADSVSTLAPNIEENIGISREKAEEIKKELIEKIFGPIAEQLTKKLKENLKDKKVSWDQNVAFILSGGDYSVFFGTPHIKTKMVDAPEAEKAPVNYSKIEDLKNKFTI